MVAGKRITARLAIVAALVGAVAAAVPAAAGVTTYRDADGTVHIVPDGAADGAAPRASAKARPAASPSPDFGAIRSEMTDIAEAVRDVRRLCAKWNRAGRTTAGKQDKAEEIHGRLYSGERMCAPSRRKQATRRDRLKVEYATERVELRRERGTVRYQASQVESRLRRMRSELERFEKGAEGKERRRIGAYLDMVEDLEGKLDEDCEDAGRSVMNDLR